MKLSEIPYLHRQIEKALVKQLQKRKVIVLYGPRQVGKTTLANNLTVFGQLPVVPLVDGEQASDTHWVNGELKSTQEIFSSQNLHLMMEEIGKKRYLIVDEAQRIPNIGLNLKILHDNVPDLRIIATGSASLELAASTHEPLTGRQHTFFLYPLSLGEVRRYVGPAQLGEMLESLVLFGMYPEVVKEEDRQAKIDYLQNLIRSSLYVDLLAIENILSDRIIKELLELLALQIGQEVSLNELGRSIGINKLTIKRYLDLLEKAFIIKRVSGLSRNLRKEISKNAKYYFWDTGIRNALINNFSPLHLRPDKGALWENFIVMERIKLQANTPLYSNNYFWRTYDGQEIDWVEEREGKIFAYEIKWKNQNSSPPAAFSTAYPNATYAEINSQNFLDYFPSALDS